MSLDNFRNRAIVWDTVNKDFPQPIQVMQGDVNARTLSVKIIDNGGEIDLTGHSLKLTYQYTNSSNSGFVMIPPENLTKGEFILVIPTEMTKPGVIEANLILLNEDKEQVIVSKNLTFISDNSTVTALAQEVNNKIDDFTKILLENMPQVMRSELNDLHAQTESNTSNIELKANQTDLNNLQTTVNNQGITISTAAQETEVRSMISLLDNVKQTKRVARINLLLEQYKTSGYYRQYTNGEKLVNTDYDLFDMVPVNADTDYCTGISPNAHIAFYDFEQKYISGLLKPQPSFAIPSSYLNTLVVKVPTNAKYMS